MLPFIKFEYDECINAKKEILSAEINILNLAKSISEYRKIRKSEMSKKVALKTALRHNMTKLNLFVSEFPEIRAGFQAGKMIEKKVETGRKKGIEADLAEIKEKLARLNA